MSADRDLKRITIDLPAEMLEQLRADAAAHDVSVVEHIRQCVSLWRELFEGDPEITVKSRDGRQWTIRIPVADTEVGS